MKSRTKCETKPTTIEIKPSTSQSKSELQKNYFNEKKLEKKKLKASFIQAKNLLDHALITIENRHLDRKDKAMKKKLSIDEIFKKYSLEQADEVWTPLPTDICRDLYQHAHRVHQKKDSLSSVHSTHVK